MLFTGGGTAGHVIPAIPVMRALRASGVEIGFVGSRSGLEEDLLREEDLQYFGIASGKLRRYFSLENLVDAFRVLLGIFNACVVVARFRPDAVFSKGGFVSFPVVLAAWLWRVPVIAHESDLTPGLANRLALPFIRCLCVNFPVTESSLSGRFKGRIVHTGTPVRPVLLDGDGARGRQWLNIAEGEPILLVTGGSLGADALNTVVREALGELTGEWQVVHVCGPGKLSAERNERYQQFEYVREQWGDVLAAADLVVSRAGANTLYELLALRKPNLLVPLSQKASRGDQIENADYARELGYSEVIAEEALTSETLVRSVADLRPKLAEITRRLEGFQVPDSVALLAAEILAELK